MKVLRLSVLPLRTVLVALTLSALALPPFVGAADFSLNPARDFGAIRRIDPRDYSGLAVVREDGSGLSSSTAAAFRAALEVFSKAEVNASDALNVRLDGSRNSTGFQRWNGNYGVAQSTSDGADTGSILGSGGGYTSGNLYDRGAAWILYGNEYTTIGGQARYYAGNVSTGDHIFYTGAGVERFRITYNGNAGFGTTAPISRLDLGDSAGGKAISWGGPSGANNYANIWTAYSNSDLVMATGMIGSETSDIYRQSYTGSWLARSAIRLTANGTGGIRFFADPGDSTAKGVTVTPTERMRITPGGNVLIGTTTDDGVNKLQVNGPVYVASYVSALGYIDRTEAPDTIADAYEIVESHEIDANGNLDHSKLSPLAYGKKVQLVSTGKMTKGAVAELVMVDGKKTMTENTVTVPEMAQVVVPDPSGRDLSMVISAQAFVIKDLIRRIEALEATR